MSGYISHEKTHRSQHHFNVHRVNVLDGLGRGYDDNV